MFRCSLLLVGSGIRGKRKKYSNSLRFEQEEEEQQQFGLRARERRIATVWVAGKRKKKNYFLKIFAF